jgi:CheY-like chemotaxis protein
MDTEREIAKEPPDSRAVLLVEDNREDAMFFQRAFRSAGFENPLHTVHTSDEARAYLRGQGQYNDRAQYPLPRLLVIDTILGGTSGFELLAWVRQQPQFNPVAAIMFSGDGGPNEEQQAVRLGANAYHHKPAALDELQSLIRRVGDFWLLGGPSVE